MPKTATRQRRDCDLKPGPSAPESSTLTTRLPTHPHKHCRGYYASRPRGHTGIVRSVRLSVPWRSCLGYRHAGCLLLSHRRPPQMCGLRIRPQTDVDPPRFFPPSNCHLREHIVSPPPGRYLVFILLCSKPHRPIRSNHKQQRFTLSWTVRLRSAKNCP